VARGEFLRSADPIEVIETLIAPLYLRVLVTGEPVHDWPRHAMVDRVLAQYPAGSRRVRLRQ